MEEREREKVWTFHFMKGWLHLTAALWSQQKCKSNDLQSVDLELVFRKCSLEEIFLANPVH